MGAISQLVNQSITILAIESSCDDTSAAVCRNGKVISNIVSNQTVHEIYGGVVPELASRAHQQHIIPTVQMALEKAEVKKSDLSAIAFTQGPGLMGSLLVGCSFSKALALGLGIPLIGVNHLQGHVLSHFIDSPVPEFPFLCLLVSGGHTQIIKVADYFTMQVIGSTTDDAAGEAFDKTAKILGLPYPGGILIDRYAALGNPKAFSFPEPKVAGFDYSFSGLKTAFMYFLRDRQAADLDFILNNLNDICASVQFSIVSFLLRKLIQAAESTGIKQIAVAGGVSANTGLRAALSEAAEQYNWQLFLPQFQYCTDNAGMIAQAAHFKFIRGQFTSQQAVPFARMEV